MKGNQDESWQIRGDLILFGLAALSHWKVKASPWVLHWLLLQMVCFLFPIEELKQQQSMVLVNCWLYPFFHHFIASTFQYNYAILCTYFPLSQTNQTQVWGHLHQLISRVPCPLQLEWFHGVIQDWANISSLLKFCDLKDKVHLVYSNHKDDGWLIVS